MRASFVTRLIWSLLGVMLCLTISDACAALTYWGRQPDKDRLVVQFSVALPESSPKRVGPKTILIPVPPETWKREPTPSATNFSSSELIQKVEKTDQGLLIHLRTDAFSFSSFKLTGEKKLALDIGKDANGKKWKAPEDVLPEKPAEKKDDTKKIKKDKLQERTLEDQKAAPPQNATDSQNTTVTDNVTNATSPSAPEEPAPVLGPVRSKIIKPEPKPAPKEQTDTNQSVEIPAAPKPVAPVAENKPAQIVKGSVKPASPPVVENSSLAATSGSAEPAQNASVSSALPVNGTTPAQSASVPKPQNVNATGQDGSSAPLTAAVRARIIRPGTEPQNASVQNVDRNATTVPQAVPPAEPVVRKFAVQSRNASHAESPILNGTDVHTAAVQNASHSPVPSTPAVSTSQNKQIEHTAVPAEKAVEHPSTPSPDAAAPAEHGEEKKAEAHGEKKPEDGHGGEAKSGGHGEGGNATVNKDEELNMLFAKAQTALMDGQIGAGVATVNEMLALPYISDDLRETLLYSLADLTMQLNKDDLSGNFTGVMDAYQTAKNFNPKSAKMPEALLNIGYLHLSVGNVPEAKAHFDLMRKKYPNDPRIPLIDYYWGEHFMKRKEYAKAADHFQYVVQNYPNSKGFQPSSLGLVKCFSELGYYDKAFSMVKAVEEHWPRHYLSDIEFLITAGYAAMMSGQLDKAKDYFWAYYNIAPSAENADIALARIGDILVKSGKHEAAREVYEKAAKDFPDKEGGLIAQMRLAEEGVLDKPSVEGMTAVFERPFMESPEKIYQRILELKDSSLAPVARLKLAMLYLWNKKYAKSLEEVSRFLADYPKHELEPRAREVANKALKDWLVNDVEQGNYKAVTERWKGQEGSFKDSLDPQIRLAVATAFLKMEQPGKALELAEPLVFTKEPKNEYSEPGMDLVISTLLDLKRWSQIVDLGKRVARWGLPADRQRQVDYAVGLAYENLDKHSSAKPLWTKLAADPKLDDGQRAYALYFLARGAMTAGDMGQVNTLANDALQLFLKDKSDIPKIRDCLDLLMRAAERSGRGQDALNWMLEYGKYMPETDPDWAAFMYRKALLFKKNSMMDQWKESLDLLIAKAPNTLYSRMAASELESVRIEKEVGKFK